MALRASHGVGRLTAAFALFGSIIQSAWVLIVSYERAYKHVSVKLSVPVYL